MISEHSHVVALIPPRLLAQDDPVNSPLLEKAAQVFEYSCGNLSFGMEIIAVDISHKKDEVIRYSYKLNFYVILY